MRDESVGDAFFVDYDRDCVDIGVSQKYDYR
jgi:hypothetical protein